MILHQKILFFPILGGGGHMPGGPSPLDPPLVYMYPIVLGEF